METLILVNEQDFPLGEATREECHHFPGKLHRAILVILKNKKGQILLAQRAKGKLWEGLWEGTCATHVYPSETAQKAAQRALQKELNLKNVDLKYQGKFLYRARWGKEGIEHEICHVFFGKIAGEPVVNKNEVIGLKWITKAGLRKKIEEDRNLLTPWFLIALRRFTPSFDRTQNKQGKPLKI